MNQFKQWVLNSCAAALIGAASLALVTQPASAAEEAKGPKISQSIAKEIIAAQKALQGGQFAEGLKHLEAAEAVSPLTAFDKKTIDELKAFADIKLNNLKAAATAYEAALATGATSPEETARYQKAVLQIAYTEKDYPKAIEIGKKIIESPGGANHDTYAIVTNSYFLQKDCKNAVIWADKSIAFARVAHEAPKETEYQIKLQCASDTGDTAAMTATLEELVRSTNKTEYWKDLLLLSRQDERDDHNLLMIYRVMYNTNTMTKGSDYMEMAQLLGDAALPAEAGVVLDKGLSTGVIPADQKDRTQRLQTALKPRAEADKKNLVQFDSEASKSAAGELDVKLGEVYYGFGDYQNSVTAINRGLQKGQIKHLDEAYVYLGLAQQNLKNIPEAKKAFNQVKTVPNESPRVAKLWQLYADKLE